MDTKTNESELEEMLEQYRKIQETINNTETESDDITTEEICLNFNIFTTWMSQSIKSEMKNLYEEFAKTFDAKYRTDLYEMIADNFCSDIVSDKLKFYWSMLIINLLENSKTYKYRVNFSTVVVNETDGELPVLTYDIEKLETNLKIKVVKHVFVCMLKNERLCYFKENGNDYYVS